MCPTRFNFVKEKTISYKLTFHNIVYLIMIFYYESSISDIVIYC